MPATIYIVKFESPLIRMNFNQNYNTKMRGLVTKVTYEAFK